jgi:hypothetical protein
VFIFSGLSLGLFITVSPDFGVKVTGKVTESPKKKGIIGKQESVLIHKSSKVFCKGIIVEIPSGNPSTGTREPLSE